MNIYPILVFLHVLGGVGIFVALTIEAVTLGRLRQADTVADARASMRMLAPSWRLGGIAMLATLVSGVWMTVQWWGPRPWIQAAMVTVVGMAVLGGGVTGRRMRRLRAALSAETGSTISAVRSIQSSKALAASLRLRIALGVGILALMTLKPDLVVSLAVMGIAIAAGILAGVYSSRRSESQSTLEWKGVRP